MNRDFKCIYGEYFGMHSEPFGLTPDPEYLFLSNGHTSAIEWMTYAIEQYDMGLVIGEIGSGKTLLSRCLVDYLPEDKYRVCLIINPQCTPSAMLKDIYRQLFGKEPPYFKRAVLKCLHEGLVDLMVKNIFPVVIIDEAQAILGKPVFDEFRMLNNFQTDKQNLISFILLGQPELEKRLKHKAYRALLQRIRFSTNLKAFTTNETGLYLAHRMKVSGYKGRNVFSDQGIQIIQELSCGYPRPINHLALFSLMQVMSNNTKTVSADVVKEAASEIIYLRDKVK